MQMQRIFSAAILTIINLVIASIYLQSPYQLWLLMAGVGAITGVSFKTGQRHVITGFGIGIVLTMIREVITYGPNIIELTGLVYAAGYLFAVATTITLRTIILKLSKPPKTAA